MSTTGIVLLSLLPYSFLAALIGNAMISDKDVNSIRLIKYLLWPIPLSLYIIKFILELIVNIFKGLYGFIKLDILGYKSRYRVEKKIDKLGTPLYYPQYSHLGLRWSYFKVGDGLIYYDNNDDALKYIKIAEKNEISD